MVFWTTQLLYPLTFGDISNDFYYDTGLLIQTLTYSLCAFLCFGFKTVKEKSVFLLIVLYAAIDHTADYVFGDVNPNVYLLETALFMFWSLALILRAEIKQPANINYDNILLAFYKGDSGSFIMKLSELFGWRVKSMCIIAGGNCLKLKSNKDTFQFSNTSGSFFRRDSDYYIHDTGKPYTKEFVEEMARYGKVKAIKNGFRIRCIEAVGELLALIGEEYRPTNPAQNAPSIYFGKIIRL